MQPLLLDTSRVERLQSPSFGSTSCQRYIQVSDNFLRSDHPAVARTRPRAADTQNADPSEGVELKEAVPSHVAYIIPIPDVTIETIVDVLDTPKEDSDRYNINLCTVTASIHPSPKLSPNPRL